MTTDYALDGLEKAMVDTLMCGTGIMKFSMVDGKLDCAHVPIKDFLTLAEELKFRHDNTADWLKQ